MDRLFLPKSYVESVMDSLNWDSSRSPTLYNRMVYIEPENIWIVVVGFIIAFVLSLGIGANDVANTFGTSVGAKVLTLKQAIICASIVETLGAVFLGAKVSDTIRKGIIDIDQYENQTGLLMVGNIASLSSSCIWLFVATFLKLPVSATHSIVGSTIGFALVAHGSRGVAWLEVVKIIGSWFISPLMSGIVSTSLFMFIKIFILNKADALEPGLRFLPIFYAVVLAINVFSIFFEGPKLFHFHKIPLWGVFVMSFGTGIVCAILVRIFLVPWQRKRIIEQVKNMAIAEEKDADGKDNNAFVEEHNFSNKEQNGDIPMDTIASNGHIETGEKEKNTLDEKYKKELVVEVTPDGDIIDHEANNINNDSKKEDARDGIEDKPEQARLFSFLQILTALFGGFAHGGNDVSNAIGPVITIWMVATTGSVTGGGDTPIWILFLGGVGISLGLLIWGRRVIETLGNDLTKITPSSGFCIEIGSALTVLMASNIGIPISSTHCKVGSIVIVGRVRSKENVNWSIFRNIVGAWVMTLPVCMGLSAAIMAGLRYAV